jgi:hypothetical protein
VTEINKFPMGPNPLFFRARGNASIANALQRSKVTSIQWYLSITAKIFKAYFFVSSLLFASISKANLSIEASPVVSPDINPPKRTNATDVLPQRKIESSSLWLTKYF